MLSKINVLILCCLACIVSQVGCVTLPVHHDNNKVEVIEVIAKPKIIHKPRKLTTDEKILRLFNEDKDILMAFEKGGCDLFTISKYFNEYKLSAKTSSLEGFFEYLRKFPGISPHAWNRLFEDVKLNYKLIKRYETN